MKEHNIMVEIDEEGRISADADGFEGETCLAELEELLGGLPSPTERLKKKPDAYQVGVTGQTTPTITLGRKK